MASMIGIYINKHWERVRYFHVTRGLILGLHPANERRRYKVTTRK